MKNYSIEPTKAYTYRIRRKLCGLEKEYSYLTGFWSTEATFEMVKRSRALKMQFFSSLFHTIFGFIEKRIKFKGSLEILEELEIEFSMKTGGKIEVISFYDLFDKEKLHSLFHEKKLDEIRMGQTSFQGYTSPSIPLAIFSAILVGKNQYFKFMLINENIKAKEIKKLGIKVFNSGLIFSEWKSGRLTNPKDAVCFVNEEDLNFSILSMGIENPEIYNLEDYRKIFKSVLKIN